MSLRQVIAAAILLVSIPALAQVEPQATAGRKHPLNWSVGGGMDYFSGDWRAGDINRWGPSLWVSTNLWHCLGTNIEGHSMIIGGNKLASDYKLFVGEGGLMCTTGYWGRFQPITKAQIGFASLSQPGNFTSRLHATYATWSVGGGAEYHTGGHWWTRVEYTYEALPNFHSSVTGQNHNLNPRGFTFGETYRFGRLATHF